jgi:hypothetical protein
LTTAEEEVNETMARLTDEERDQLPDDAFAFPKERKEPLIDASHVRDAIARFDQVEGVTNQERDAAWQRIEQAAKRFHLELQDQDWRQLFKRNGRPIPQD